MPEPTTRRESLWRLLKVIAVALQLATVVVFRRLRGAPSGGPELLRQALQELGGAFLKFGQVLSLQVEFLPPAYCNALLDLLDLVPSFPRPQVEQILIDGLGTHPANRFASFDYTPIAAASIGQVHRGVLENGAAVAVKVQRPGIDRVFERDCRLLEGFVRLIVFLEWRSLYFLRESVRELSAWTRDELDYRREAAYCESLGRHAKDNPAEKVPKVFWELTTTRVLTLEFLEGPSVAQYFRFVESPLTRDFGARLDALRAGGFVPATFTANIISNFLRDAFIHGAFHADLHPANLLILPGNVVGYVDFGIVAFLTEETRRRMVRLILAFARGDLHATYEALMDVCALDRDSEPEAVRRKIWASAHNWYEQPAVAGNVRFRVSVTKAFLDLFTICREHGVYLDREMVRFIRSIFYIDGLVSRLDAGSDLAGQLRHAVELWQSHQARRTVTSSAGILTFLTELVLWAQTGPAGLFRLPETLDRITSAPAVPLPEAVTARGLRWRTTAAAAVWVVIAIPLGFGGVFPSFREAPLFAVVALFFVIAWTLWLIRLVWRASAD